MARNVYVGPNSIVGISISGQVDTAYELIKLTYALAYDLRNLTLIDNKGRKLRATPQLINGRFAILYRLADKKVKKKWVKNVIDRFHKLCLSRLHGMPYQVFVNSIKAEAVQYLSPIDIMEVEQKVNYIEYQLGEI